LKRQSALSHIKGVVFSYGNFDLSALPSLRELGSTEAPILNYEDAEHFLNAYLPGLGSDQRKDPTMSPAYNNLDGLVPALFIVGTKDGLLDDSILMASRWQLAGNEAILKFVPGGCHGFMTFNGHAVEVTCHGWDLMLAFLTTKLGI
jgi:acetyl esterase/lipase